MKISRRGFIGAIAAAVLGRSAVKKLIPHARPAIIPQDHGISLRHIQQWDAQNDQMVTRIDILYSFALQKPEWSIRVLADESTPQVFNAREMEPAAFAFHKQAFTLTA